MTPETTAHPSTLRLHRLRLGELDVAETRELRAHLDGCARCAERHQHQLATEAEFRAMPAPAWAVAPAPARSWWSRVVPWAVPLLAAAAAMLVFLPDPAENAVGAEPAGVAAEDGTREKGLLEALQVWVQGNGAPRPIAHGERLGAGAKVQLRFHPRGHRFVTLAGRDGAGTIEVYGTLEPHADRMQAASFALTLDGSPGTQRFFAFLSDRAPTPDDVRRSLAAEPVQLAGAEIAQVAIPKVE